MLFADRDGIWSAACGRGAYWLGALVPTGGQPPLGARAVLDTGCVRGGCVRRQPDNSRRSFGGADYI